MCKLLKFEKNGEKYKKENDIPVNSPPRGDC